MGSAQSQLGLQARATTQQWPGWVGTKHMFVFGDSYTQSAFNWEESSGQPRVANPMGNTDDGYAVPSSGDLAWPTYLTLNYNVSTLLTADLAFFGATVGDGVIGSNNLPSPVSTFKNQTEQVFIPYYVNSKTNMTWQSNDTLFAIFFGVNDVNFVGGDVSRNTSYYYPAEFQEYRHLIDEMYLSGARNFLLLNTPAIDRSPESLGTTNDPHLKEAIAEWNGNITQLASNITKAYSSVTAFVYDTNALFTGILNNPQNSYNKGQTSGLTNLTGACPYYANKTNIANVNDPSCSGPASSYFWHDGLHPMFPVQKAMAYNISQFLSNQPTNM